MESVVLVILVLLVAVLYASVGHGGASGYLAVMALVGVAPAEMRPTALVLNVLVAGLGTWRFYRAGYFSWPTFWPFAAFSIPFAFLGGLLSLPEIAYKPLVGLVLFYAGFRVFQSAKKSDPTSTKTLPRLVGPTAGSGIGLVSGLTGVGGGIFLSPILLLSGWTTTRQTSSVAAAFVLVNSMAGLAGLVANSAMQSSLLPLLVPPALLGGLIGSQLGTRRLPTKAIRRLLAVVLIVAGLKMILTTAGLFPS